MDAIKSRDERMQQAEQIRIKLISTGKFPRSRTWMGGEVVRVYTGYASEYLTVEVDGGVTTSKSRMTWGRVIDETIS